MSNIISNTVCRYELCQKRKYEEILFGARKSWPAKKKHEKFSKCKFCPVGRLQTQADQMLWNTRGNRFIKGWYKSKIGKTLAGQINIQRLLNKHPSHTLGPFWRDLEVQSHRKKSGTREPLLFVDLARNSVFISRRHCHECLAMHRSKQGCHGTWVGSDNCPFVGFLSHYFFYPLIQASGMNKGWQWALVWHTSRKKGKVKVDIKLPDWFPS